MEKEKNIVLILAEDYIKYLEGIGKKEEIEAYQKGLSELAVK